MKVALAGAAEKAKNLTAKPCGRSRNFLRFIPRVMQTVRGLFPLKTALQLSGITGNPVRTWEYWLSKERADGEAVCALIASDDGMAIVDAIAGQSPWWRRVRESLALFDQQQAALQEAANALTALSASPASFRVPNVAGAVDRSLARPGVARMDAPRHR